MVRTKYIGTKNHISLEKIKINGSIQNLYDFSLFQWQWKTSLMVMHSWLSSNDVLGLTTNVNCTKLISTLKK